jgi:hypothetical protein
MTDKLGTTKQFILYNNQEHALLQTIQRVWSLKLTILSYYVYINRCSLKCTAILLIYTGTEFCFRYTQNGKISGMK